MKPIFTKNLFTNLLNLIGLTVAFAAFIVILSQVRYDLGFDKHYKDSDKIYRVECAFDKEEVGVYSSSLSRPYALKLQDASSDVVSLAQLNIIDSYELKPVGSEELYMTNCLLMDKSGLELFGYEIIEGDTTNFISQDVMLVSESLAKALSPDESPVGKVIKSAYKNQFTVVGVYKDFPENSSLYNGMVIPFGNYYDNDYSEWSFPIYVKLNSSDNAARVSQIFIDKAIEMFNSSRDYFQKEGYDVDNMIRLTPIHDVYFAKDIHYDYSPKGNISTTYSLLAVAVLIILIAIINFINLSLASVPMRMRNINTRKVLGSTTFSLRLQQISQAVAIALVSYLLALVVVNAISGTTLASLVSSSLKLSNNISILVLGLIISLLTGVAAGLYPAIYSTSFAPAIVLKGSFSLSPKGRALRNTLIAFQYVISFVLIIVALFINVQTKYMKGYNMGFVDENILNFYIPEEVAQKGDTFAKKLKENTMIEDVTFARDPLVSNSKMGWGRDYKGTTIHHDCYVVASNFIDFFGLEIVEGRGFTKDDELKVGGTFVFNETAHKTFQFELNEKMPGHHDSEMAEIVGIVKDFNFKPLQYGISPISLYVFGSEPWWSLRYTYIKMAKGANLADVKQYIVETINEFGSVSIPASKINIEFMDDVTGRLYAKEDALGKLILIFCLLSVLLSVIGILGLIYFETQFKKGEIALRRVFGSTSGEILKMLNLSYIKIMSISFLAAVPISIVVIKLWLKNFTYKSPIPIWIFVVAYIAIFIITTLIITLRSLRAANENPVNSIKTE